MIKAFVINLSSAKERREWMKNQINSIEGIEFIFFDAINPKSEHFLQYRKYWDWDHLTKLYRGKALTDGEKACFASHDALWEQCLKTRENILVLEDDLVLDQNFRQKVFEIIQNQELGFVRLMAYFEKKSFEIQRGIYQTFEGICGTQGYYLTPRCALLFLNRAKIWFCPVDNYMDKTYLHGVENLYIKPAIIRENSTLQSCIDMKGGGIENKKLYFYTKSQKKY